MPEEPSPQKQSYTPQAAALEVTLRCDMSCLHCGSDASRRDRPDVLSFEDWCGVVDELKKIGVPHCTLSGGEPFLYPRWRELVTHIRSRGLGVNFISNGWNITEDDMRFMKEARVEHIGVSLDGDEAVHDRIRRTPGSFARVVRLLDWCRQSGMLVCPTTSFNKLNFEVREMILQVILDHGAKFWQVQIVNSFGRAGKLRDKLLLGPEQFTALCDDVLRWQKECAGRLRVMAADSLGYCHPVTDEILGDCEWQGCNAGMYVLGIQADGTVLGCLSLQDKSFAAGNVRQRPLSEIWNDDSAFAYTRLHDASKLEGACKACGKAAVCKAGCLGMAFSTTGTIGRNPYCYKAIAEARSPVRRP